MAMGYERTDVPWTDRVSEADALEHAFRSHYAELLRLTTFLAGRKETAEDLVQEAFVRAAPRLGALGSDEAFPYLRRTVVNLWKNRLRRLALERRTAVPASAHQRDETSSIEAREDLRVQLRRLSPKQRACLVLKYYADLSERDIADLLRCSVGSVKKHTARALSRMREDMPS